MSTASRPSAHRGRGRAGPRSGRRRSSAIEQQYGVDRWIILAIWGIETSFGANNGGFDVIRSLATLTVIGYRPDFFRDELLAR
jgi:membrane-bound lytic murein transglycosylase B